MSTTQARPVATRGPARASAAGPVFEELAGREVPLGGPRAMLVRRTLPHRVRRTVGAWCFVDHYGSSARPPGAPMHVPPHPHTGLQTVTWLFDGEVRHRDSLGSDQLVRPGELNLMTAGRGIAHAEDSVVDAAGGARGASSPPLHGLQLWVALPAAQRGIAPAFEHHPDLPRDRTGPVTTTVIVGELAGARSGATAHSPLLAAEATLAGGAATTLALRPDFEHAVLAVDGDVRVDGRRVPAETLVYLGRARTALDVATDRGGRLVLLGGTPFEDPLVMWWNFVGGEHDEIAAARADWEAGRRFDPVPDYGDERLAAPALPTTRLLPR